MRWVRLLALAALVVVVHVAPAVTAQMGTFTGALRCETPPGTPLPEGGRAEAALTTDRDRYPLGAPVRATFTLTNPTDVPARVVTNNISNFEVRAVAGNTRVWSTFPPDAPVPVPVALPCILDPGVTVTLTFTWNQRVGSQYGSGEPVPAGDYEISGGYFSGPRATARFTIEAATPTPSAPPATVHVVRTLGTRVIPPESTVRFVYPITTPAPGQPLLRGVPPPITAENRSDQAVAATYSGFFLTLEAPAGSLIRLLDVPDTPARCEPREGAVVRCDAFSSAHVAFTLVSADVATDVIDLPAGCTNTTLTWAQLTPLRIVAAAITPPGALESIWRFIPARQRFLGFAAAAPDNANDYTAVITPLEAVFICMTTPGTLTRPAA